MKWLLSVTGALCCCVLLAACHGHPQLDNSNSADSIYHHLHNSVSAGCDTFRPQHYVVPQARGYVSDYEDLLSDAEEAQLSDALKAYQAGTGNQIAIVTITPKMTGAGTFDCYTLLLANTWGVGQKGNDNGIVVAISQEYRMMRINIGKGLEQRLSNEATKAIIDTAFVPSFTKDKYAAGILKGVTILMQALDRNK